MASSIDTFRSMSLGQGSKGRKKVVTQPTGILKEQNTQLFPPPRPIIRTLNTEQLDAMDAQRTVTKEAPKRKRATMEEIKKLERELSEAKERNMRCNLRCTTKSRQRERQ